MREELAARLGACRPEIEQEILTRVYTVSDPADVGDSTYVEGLRAAVAVGLSYALHGLDAGDPQPGPVPAELLAQARLAAQEGVSLDTVLRRYLAGHTLLGDFIVQKAEEMDLSHETLKQLLRTQGTLVDRLLAAIAAEYEQANRDRLRTSEQRQANRVKQLLAGDLSDPPRLGYDLDLWHLGLIAAGPGAEEAVCALAATLDHRRLVVRPHQGAAWAWFGSASPIATDSVLQLASRSLPTGVALSIGEPAAGLAGWRLTHRQAEAALPIAIREANRAVRYKDVAMLATALRDEVLARSLRDVYMAPLALEQDGGEALRQTLRAYFAAGGNASSAAAQLKLSRQTVNERLRKIEKRLARPVQTCAPELETALRLYKFEHLPDN